MKAILSVSALALLAATPALATTYTVTDVETTYADNSGIVNGPNWDSPWTTPIIMTTSGGQVFTVYCDDLFANVYVGGGQDLTYETGLVTTNGSGGALTEATSNVLGQIARAGLLDAAGANQDGAIAAQAAIWGFEYGGPVTSTDATIQSDIYAFMDNTHDNGTGWAHGLISLSGTQDQILASAAVPETSTWLMLLVGFSCLGYAASKRARAVRVQL
jgi:hypothetical protein